MVLALPAGQLSARETQSWMRRPERVLCGRQETGFSAQHPRGMTDCGLCVACKDKCGRWKVLCGARGVGTLVWEWKGFRLGVLPALAFAEGLIPRLQVVSAG